MKKTVPILLLITAALLLAIAGCERKVVVEDGDQTALTSCFTCHDDQDMELTAIELQWQRSVHASGNNSNRNRNYQSSYQACERCHTAEGFIASLEGGDASGEHFSPIHCFACHAPHTNGNLSLRTTAPVTLSNSFVFDRGVGNACAVCHHGRRNVDTYVADSVEVSSHWGPHYSQQGDMLIGSNAYEYDGYTYGNSAHTNAAVDGCPMCHMAAPVGIYVGGHTFFTRFRDDFENLDFQDVNGCNVAACHNGEIEDFDRLAREDFDHDTEIEGVQTEIEGMLDSLRTLLIAGTLLDPGTSEPPDDRVVATADSAGALFNFLFVEEDRSEGIHNTLYAVDLLQSSINFMATGSPSGMLAAKDDFRRTFASAH